MREIDFANGLEQEQYAKVTTERFIDAVQLDVDHPFSFKRVTPAYQDDDGAYHSETIFYDSIEELQLLRKLKGVAVTTRFREMKEVGRESTAKFVLDQLKTV